MVRFTLVVNKDRLVGLEKQQQFDKKTKTGEVGKTQKVREKYKLHT